MVKIAVGLIKLYRVAISPWLGSNCRFHPSCSAYAEEAFNTYGFFKGGYMTARRLIKCHPFHPGGYDPVVADSENKRKDIDTTNHSE